MQRPSLVLKIFILIFLAAAATVDAAKMTLLYWSDFNAQNTPRTVKWGAMPAEVGGAAELSGIVNTIRSTTVRTLVVNAGGEFTGTPVSMITKGASQVKILNEIGIDVFVPGMREFDHGRKSLQETMSRAEFPILLSNVSDSKSGSKLFRGYRIFKLSNVVVGVLGLIDEDFRQSVIHEGIVGLITSDPVVEARTFVDTFRDSCHVLVAVTHQGWKNDSLLAEEVDGLDLIVGAKHPTPFETFREVNGTVILQTGPNGTHIGKLIFDADLESGGGAVVQHEMIVVGDETYPADEDVSALVDRLERKYTKRLNRRIGTLQTPWEVNPEQPCNLAQWFVGTMHRIAPTASLALINNGSLHKGMARGPIVERDLWEIYPYEHSVAVFQLSGEELFRAIKSHIINPGEFLTWSGLYVSAKDGRIDTLAVRGKPVTALDDFSIISSGYVWDKLEMYFGVGKKDRPVFFIPGNLREYIVKAVERRGTISYEMDNRWNVRQVR